MLGRLDEPLADQRIDRCPLDPAAIYSSPLRRALDTARAMFPSREIAVVPDLAECGAGEWEGLAWNEIAARWPRQAAAKTASWSEHAAPGGEPWGIFAARVTRALDRIRAGPFPAAVVAHAGVNAVLASRIAGADPIRHLQDYCEVITLELRD
jgi:broad specificity phosphatase PhoE